MCSLQFCIGLSFILFTATTQSKKLDCREGWLSTDDSCYKMLDGGETWEYAQKICQAEQASLLVIQNDKERQWLMSQMATFKDMRIWWLGLSGIDKSSGRWNQSVVPTKYSPPLADEPDNANGKENCVMISSRGYLRDEDCSLVTGFICKAEKPTPEYDCKPASDLYTGVSTSTSSHCYWFNMVDANWSEAKKFCQAIHIADGKNGDLLSIQDTDELKAVQKKVATFTTEGNSWWTGLNDRKKKNTYVFSDGTPYSADNVQWLTKKTAIESGDTCWAILSSGKATLAPCDFFMGPICKHSRVAEASSKCPPYWRAQGDTCYFFGEETMTWQGAVSRCKSLGGQSLKTDSDQERAWLKTTSAFGPGGRQYWTSLKRQDGSRGPGKFAWEDGSPVNDSLVDWDASLHASSKCLVLNAKDKMANYRKCSAPVANVACEYTLKPNSKCVTGWVQFQSKCYYISPGTPGQKHNWMEVKTVCRDTVEKETLANAVHYITIDNDAQIDFVSSTVMNLNTNNQKIVWLGLNSRHGLDDWIWEDAPEVPPNTIYFNNFKQPNPFFPCGVITQGARFRTKNCTEQNFYLCEKAKGNAQSNFSNQGLLLKAFCSTLLLFFMKL